MEKNTDIPVKGCYFLICDVHAIDARHRTRQLDYMGFITGNDREGMVHYFQRPGKSKEPVVFIYRNKICDPGLFMDRKEFGEPGMKPSYDEIPRLRLSRLMKQQHEDMESMGYNPLGSLPDYRKTEGVCREAVRIDPYNIRHVPDYMLSREIIGSALEQEGNTLQYIPDGFKTRRACLNAIKGNPGACLYIPDNLKSESFYKDSVKLNNRAFRYIPEDKLTPEICLLAVMADAGLKDAVPAVIRNGKNIYSLNERLERILVGRVKPTFEQVLDIYRGGSLVLEEARNGIKVLNNSNISYISGLDRFVISPIRQDNENPVLPKDSLAVKKGQGRKI